MNHLAAVAAGFSKRQKLSILLLALYWPTLFVLAHIPIPQIVRQANVSDKSLHFLSYMILVFLLWSAIKPDKKVDWRKATAWLVLLVVVWYGVCDEWLQRYVAGRTTDINDFAADLAGAVTSLIVLSIFSFWPTSLIVTGITVFGLTNCARADLSKLVPVINTLFQFLSYALFTALWARYTRDFLRTAAPKLRWLATVLALPSGLLLVVRLSSVIAGRNFNKWDVIISAAGIATVIAGLSVVGLFRQRSVRTRGLSPADT